MTTIYQTSTEDTEYVFTSTSTDSFYYTKKKNSCLLFKRIKQIKRWLQNRRNLEIFICFAAIILSFSLYRKEAIMYSIS